MEEVLRTVAAAIDQEIGRPLEGFSIIEDEVNVDIDDDTYSATYRAESPQLKDLAVLRDRILERGVVNEWESGDVVLDDDSLDITFEKTYGAVDVMGETLFPEASVTISATQNSPEAGMTAINYDIDITLESESEHLLDILDDLKEDVDDDFSDLSDVLEEQMDIKEAAEKSIREAEEEKQELVDEAAEEGITVPAEAFGKFDDFLAQAKSALAAGNFAEAKQLAKQAEATLENIDDAIDGLREEKELKEEAEKAIQEAEEELIEKPEEEREKQEEAIKEQEEQNQDATEEVGQEEAEEQD